MEGVEERRRRLAAMREQADAAQSEDSEHVTFTPCPSGAPLLSNPLDDSSREYVGAAAAAAAAEAAAEVKESSSFDFYTDPLAGYSGSKRRKPGSGILPIPSRASPSLRLPLPSNNTSRQASAGLLPPPHLQPSVGYPPTLGPPAWQPIPYHPPYSHLGIAHPQPPSGWQAVGYHTPQYAGLAFSHQHPPQFSPQFPPHNVNHWSNRTSARGRGQGGDRAITGRFSGRGSPNGRGGDSRRDGNASKGRGVHERGREGGGIVSAKQQPHEFFRKSMVEDPWQALEANRLGKT